MISSNIITAAEASKLTAEFRQDPGVLEREIEGIGRQIKASASQGKSNVYWFGLKDMDDGQYRKIMEYFKGLGYDVIDESNSFIKSIQFKW